MLTCDLCGEELLLEEDMKTHLLLSHEENTMSCPLCPLSGVTYDELRLHVGSAHPEETTLLTGVDSGAAEGGASSSGDAWSISPSSQRHRNKAEASSHGTAQPTPPSASRKGALLSCPMCALVCSTSAILQEHVELHLMEQNSPEGRRFECPLCSTLCSNSFSLQEHVELHLGPGAAGGAAGSSASDLELARRLQDEEDTRRRQEEAYREREDFKKLQRQFGVDSSGGYSRQVERTMERAVSRGLMGPAEYHSKRAELMESLASGEDDGRTRTQGVIPALYNYYQTDGRDSAHVWLCADTDHFCSSAGDKGWGCGYRNFQMMLSCLHRLDTYAAVLPDRRVPCIPRLQAMMEAAWREGLDVQGASHFNQRLQGTRAWIGATEIYSLLTSLRIRARIVDFHRPTGPSDTHPRLFEWVRTYFSQTSSNRLPPRLVQTALPPLYLQHQDHHRTVQDTLR